MQIHPHSNNLLELSNFHESGVRKISKALSAEINGFRFTMNIGQTSFEQEMSALSLDLLGQDPVCIIGTSFAVPYFNDRKRFRALAQFLAQFSKTFVWMIPDEPFVSTCHARGIDETQTQKTVAHYRGNLTSKVKYAEYGIKDLGIESTTMLWERACKMPDYTKQLSALGELYKSNEGFKKDADRIVTKTLCGNLESREERVIIDKNRINIGKDFLLKELACILAIAISSNRPALYIYQAPWEVPILENLVGGRYGSLKNEKIGMLILASHNTIY